MKIRDIVTLDNDEDYVVASKVTTQMNVFYYLTNLREPTDMIVCREDQGELEEIIDPRVVSKLIPLFFENSKDILGEAD